MTTPDDAPIEDVLDQQAIVTSDDEAPELGDAEFPLDADPADSLDQRRPVPTGDEPLD